MRGLKLFAALAVTVHARPTVRNIKDEREFDKLLKHHSTETGLPVVVDFYSDSCGPCQMMAPIYKNLAKEYEGKAVFVKVNTAFNRQLQGRYRVNSIPTFLFFGADGKKKREFAGAGEQQLRQYTREVVNDAEKLNVRLTLDALLEFYGTHEPTKAEADITELHGKCAKMAKSTECEGGAAADLAQKLKKKYRSKPTLEKRGPKKGTESGASPTSGSSRRSKPAPAPVKEERTANLDLASLAELEGAVRQRRIDLGLEANQDNFDERRVDTKDEEGEEDDEEEEEDDEDEEEDVKEIWKPGGGPERLVIIGSGPAGLAAAVYAARAGLRPVVVAPPFGGQLMGKGVDVENFPGLMGQTGPSMVTLMIKQAASFGTRFEEGLVESVDLSTHPFKLTTSLSSQPGGSGAGEAGEGGPGADAGEKHVMETHSLIIATGADSRWLGVPGEWDLRGGGVSTCATCDGFLFRDKEVVVVGGGDTAMEDALVLARTSSKVTVVHRRDSFRASHAMAKRVLSHDKIEVIWNTSIAGFEGTPAQGVEGEDGFVFPKLTGVRLKNETAAANGDPESTSFLNCAAAFVAIGHIPNTNLFQGQLSMGSDGYLHTTPGSTATSVDGVFAAGDVADHIYRQAITSAGSGAMASLDAERWLSTSSLDCPGSSSECAGEAGATPPFKSEL